MKLSLHVSAFKASLLLGVAIIAPFVTTGSKVVAETEKNYEFNCAGLGEILPSATDNYLIQWNNAALQAVRNRKPAPTIVSRALAILNTAIYDAWAPYDPVAHGTQLRDQLRRPSSEQTLTNKNIATSYAAYRVLVDLFPSEKPIFDNLMVTLGYDPNNASTDTTTPIGIGNVTAQALLDFRHNDGSNQLGNLAPGAYSDYTGYQPVNAPLDVFDPNSIRTTVIDPSRWQPLIVSNGQGGQTLPQRFATPHWNLVTPFALTSASQLRSSLAKTEEFGKPGFMSQAEQLIALGANLTPQQKMIAEYWADGPGTEFPPGHWHLFGQCVSKRDQHTLDSDVKMFFALSNAVFDAGLAAWDAKRIYDYARPITAIRFLYQGQTIFDWRGAVQGEAWQPYQEDTVVTPPFAEFISGHSTFSAASAEILKRFTGRDTFNSSVTQKAGVPFRVQPQNPPAPTQDLTLSWSTFTEAADEAGASRLYGGIHFQDGDLRGRKLGRLVGTRTWIKTQEFINGLSVTSTTTTSN
jgi:hypothetical protein